MELSLVSEQFVFIDGSVRVLQHVSTAEAYLSEPAEIQSNRIVDLDVRARDFNLLFENCEVASRANGTRRRLASFSLPVRLPIEVPQPTAEVHLEFHVFVRIELKDREGQRVRRRVGIGVVFETHTMETSTNEEGYIDVLVPPGSHGAYVLSPGAQPTFFTVRADQEADATVHLVV